jgi:hypothetical protein
LYREAIPAQTYAMCEGRMAPVYARAGKQHNIGRIIVFQIAFKIVFVTLSEMIVKDFPS